MENPNNQLAKGVISDQYNNGLKYTPVEFTLAEQQEMKRLYTLSWDIYNYNYTNNVKEEFNNLSFLQRYEENLKLAIGFSAYREDDEDPFLTTGKVRKKIKVIKNFVSQYNLTSKIEAMDSKKNKIDRLGYIFKKLLDKTREIEKHPQKMELYVQEMLEQGTVFSEENYNIYNTVKVDTKGWTPDMPISEFVPDDKPVISKERMCESKLHLGRYVFLGSLNEIDIQKQNIVLIYEELSREDFNSRYGHFERVKNNNIPLDIFSGSPSQGLWFNSNTNSGSSYNWNISSLTQKNRVGLLKIMEPFRNRIQILANGCPLYPVGFPLSAVSNGSFLPLAKGVLNPRPNFAYGVSEIQNSTVDQKLADKHLRGIEKKADQALAPTLVTKSQQEIGEEIYTSKSVLRGIRPDDLQPALPVESRTVTDSDIEVFNLLNNLSDEKMVSREFEGGDTSQYQTATQTVNNANRSILSVDDVISAVKDFDRQLIILRLRNIISNMLDFDEYDEIADAKNEVAGDLSIFNEDEDEGKSTPKQIKRKRKIYKSFIFDGEGDDGNEIKEIFRFTDTPKTKQELDEEEFRLKEIYGKKPIILEIDLNLLRKVEVYWNIEVISAPKKDSQNEIAIEIQNLNSTIGLIDTNRKAGNIVVENTVKRELSRKLGVSPKELFGASIDQADQLDPSLKQVLEKRNLYTPEALSKGAANSIIDTPQASTPPNQQNILKSQTASIGRASQLNSIGTNINPANSAGSIR